MTTAWAPSRRPPHSTQDLVVDDDAIDTSIDQWMSGAHITIQDLAIGDGEN